MRMRQVRMGLAMLAVALVFPAIAQAKNPEVNVNPLRLSVHPGDLLGVQTTLMPSQWSFSAGAWFTYQRGLLELVDATDTKLFKVVEYQLAMDVMGQVSFFDWLSVGLDIPVMLTSRGDAPPKDAQGRLLDPTIPDRVSGTSLGDVRLGIKAALFRTTGGGFGLGLAEDLSFPTATKTNFAGDSGVTSTTRIIGDFAGHGWQAALNVGFRLKKKEFIGRQEAGHQLLYGLGVAVPVLCGTLDLIGTIEGRTSLAKPFQSKYDNGLDLMGGLRLSLGEFLLTAAGGAGALHGYGSPSAQATLGVFYAPKMDRGCVSDRDKDGIADEKDRCPDEAGSEALDGCPDRDGDRVADLDDACPDEPGPADRRGCPLKDRDGDGIPDEQDRCPDVAGLAEFLGCPDRDGDKIPDSEDRCPDKAGVKAFQGCADSDGDGIADPDDQCPDVPGVPEERGCPPSKVKVTAEKIEILEQVHFETGKAVIRPESFDLLRNVASVLKAHPEIEQIEVQGHTDNRGGQASNMRLSQKRAEAVRAFLIQEGVEASRLTAKGYGPTRPVADNKTEAGRAANRRVEFVIQKKQ